MIIIDVPLRKMMPDGSKRGLFVARRYSYGDGFVSSEALFEQE
jgi:hypothetical protein